MDRSRLAVIALVALCFLSGCAVPESPDRFDTSRDLGYVGDYAHDDGFAFDGEETLTESQLEAVKYRSMARIELLRGLKYERDVDIEVISRAEFRSQRGDPASATAFRNELWRAAFVVDGETDVNAAMDEIYGTGVQGYYVNDRIVIVADDADEIRIDRATLVHELVHALQDQRFGLERDGATIDETRAELGLIEGEANYVPHRYDERCGDEWQCLPVAPSPTEVGADRQINVGLFLSVYAPYAEGPPFVDALRDRGGWAAVDDAHGDYPASTSQVIHPDRYPDDRPVEVDVPDRSSDEWTPITRDGEVRTETIGEATLFGALWANGVVDRPITAGAGEFSRYNYSHPATDGWAGDALTAYRDADDRDRTGHVWRLAWESDADAEEFADAYRALLENRGAESVDGVSDTYRIPDGDAFEGAYRVSVVDDTVTIVGAPTVDALGDVHATGASAASLERSGASERSNALAPSPAFASSPALATPATLSAST